MTAGQALSGKTATPMAAAGNSTSGTSGSSSDSATISANDFLTLLVTEMKNQDPTATTDPNEYINQLVNVNSLQQLISINQTLTADSTQPAASSTSNTAAPGVAGVTKNLNGAGAQTQPATSSAATGVPGAISAAAAKLAPGNLGIPDASPAASRVAQSLSGRPRVQ
jgi:flagellar basal-body rod modification protein FlgD